MTTNQKYLLKIVKEKIAEKKSAGLRIKQIKNLIWPIMLKYKSEIDQENILNAMIEIENL